MTLMLQNIVRNTQDVSDIVTLDIVRKSARLDDTYFDDLLTIDIAAARDRLEEETDCCLLTSTYTQTVDCFDRKYLELNRWPLQSIQAVRVRQNGTMVSVPVTDFEVFKDDHHHGRIKPITRWPSNQGLIEVDFTAGFTAPAFVPGQWKKLLIALSVHYIQNPDHFEDLPLGLRSAIKSASCFTPW